LDGTERHRQRPKDQETQKQFASGKTTAHTFKNQVIVNDQSQRIEYLSPTVEGQRHDQQLAIDLFAGE
jgi:hypothetical protein